MIKRKKKVDYEKPTGEDLLEVQRIVNLKEIKTGDVKKMQELIRKLYDDSCSICGHCPAQIKFAHRGLVKWFNNNRWNEYKLSELREMFPDIKATSKVEFIEKIDNKN